MYIEIWPRLNLCSEKFTKSLFKQSSYEQQLSDLIQDIRTHSQRFDTCAKLCSYETIRHTDDTALSHLKDSQIHHQEIVGQLDGLKLDQFQQNNLLGNIVVTEAGNIQEMMGTMATRFSELSEGKIKVLIETAMRGTLENFLASNDRIDFRTQDGAVAPAPSLHPTLLTSHSKGANTSCPQSSVGSPASPRYTPLFSYVIRADSSYRASTFPAAAPNGTRVRRVHARTENRCKTPNHLGNAAARPRPRSSNHALPQVTELDHQRCFLRPLHQRKSQGLHMATAHIFHQRKARRFHHVLP